MSVQIAPPGPAPNVRSHLSALKTDLGRVSTKLEAFGLIADVLIERLAEIEVDETCDGLCRACDDAESCRVRAQTDDLQRSLDELLARIGDLPDDLGTRARRISRTKAARRRTVYNQTPTPSR